ncbi:MAG TPA: glycosyltransferase [Verrucomicrobiae bacterium]|nr:glycosyltransferase [Verrucomicrobiae bacterium]
MSSPFNQLPNSKSNTPSLSVVVNTYNQPEYLRRVLRALDRQFAAGDELLLADDGSGAETRDVFEGWKQPGPMRAVHVWQEHGGFRRSRILNSAIVQAKNDYLIFLDGDSVPHPKFLRDHRSLARRGFYVQAHRAFVSEKASRYFGLGNFPADRMRAWISGQLQGWKHVFRWPFPFSKRRADLRGVRGCNLAIWREDLIRVNGYNEEFVGWGREDSELALRLMNSGVHWLDVRGRAVCYHLWHPPADRSGLDQNIRMLDEAIASQRTRCRMGLDQHMTNPA